MTNIRPDAKFLADCVRHGVVTPQKARQYIRCPLIELDIESDPTARTDTWKRRCFDFKESGGTMGSFGKEFMIFEEFVVLIKNYDDAKDKSRDVYPLYLYFRTTDVKRYIELVAPVPGKKDGYAWSWKTVKDPVSGREDIVITNVSGYRNPKPKPTFIGEEEMRALTLKGIVWVAAYLNYHYKASRYVVEVSPVKRETKTVGLRDHLNTISGPSIIYLDRLPQVKIDKERGNPTGIEQRPHPRPAYYRTLRSEVYRNHPKFMVPNGVFVRASFVGNKEAVVEGNIYRLSRHQHGEEDAL